MTWEVITSFRDVVGASKYRRLPWLVHFDGALGQHDFVHFDVRPIK